MTVVEHASKLAAECQSAGYPGTLIPYKCDLSNEEEILSMFSAIKTLHQGVDVCINNAGLARPEPLLSGKTEGWRTMIDKLAAECQSAGYPGTLIPYKCDLSNEEEILSMFSAIKTLHQGVDVCINNAGLARPEPLLSGKTEGWRTMIDVNVMAVSICTREAYQSMKERNIDDGHIININSMNGHSVVPQSVVHFYSATKYAVTALTEGLRQELREAKTHIRATCISPGLVETGFAFKLHDNDPERAAATYESIRCLKAEDMANAVIYVLSAPPHVQIGDIQMRPTEQIS
nr:PREDICTED: dehydrogenase/reductase SDR family member 11 [Apteryx mantelli mantelli]